MDTDVITLINTYETADPFKLLTALGVSLIQQPFTPETLGMTIHNDGETAVIVNTLCTEGEQLFVAAHELGHVVKHPGESTTFYRKYCHGLQIPALEGEANRFALALLTVGITDGNATNFSIYDFLSYLGLPDSMDRFLPRDLFYQDH